MAPFYLFSIRGKSVELVILLCHAKGWIKNIVVDKMTIFTLNCDHNWMKIEADTAER